MDLMKCNNRIEQLEKEIKEFDYLRLKTKEELIQTQKKEREKLIQIYQAMLTRRGEIIGLKKLIKEEQEDGSNPT